MRDFKSRLLWVRIPDKDKIQRITKFLLEKIHYTGDKMFLKFVTKNGNIATLGTMLPLSKEILKMYIKKYPIHWIMI